MIKQNNNTGLLTEEKSVISAFVEIQQGNPTLLNHMEIWKDIQGYEGVYQISNTGQVRKCKTGVIRKHGLADGYHNVLFMVNNIKKSFYIHRLVASHFIPNPENKPQVNHKDGNKSNNNDWNLEWNTGKENIAHSYAMGLSDNRGTNNGNSKLSKEDVAAIRLKYSFRKVTMKMLGKEYGVTLKTIDDILNFKTHKS